MNFFLEDVKCTRSAVVDALVDHKLQFTCGFNRYLIYDFELCFQLLLPTCLICRELVNDAFITSPNKICEIWM